MGSRTRRTGAPLRFAVPALLLAMVGTVARGADAPPPEPKAPAPKGTIQEFPRETIQLAKGVGFEMVRIPAGEFVMGSPEMEAGREPDEVPHRVRLTKAFWLARTEVTQAVWDLVMKGERAETRDPELPATDVSWHDCQVFLERLNSTVKGGGFRLPTEAEWEYACRAGTTTRFSSGDDEKSLIPYAWWSEHGGRMPRDVATRKPNPWGLYDMHGNAAEWCQDVAAEYVTPAEGVAEDPVARPIAEERDLPRIVRGGSWFWSARSARSACRGYAYDRMPFAAKFVGFRLARTVAPEADGARSEKPSSLDTEPAPSKGGAPTRPDPKSSDR